MTVVERIPPGEPGPRSRGVDVQRHRPGPIIGATEGQRIRVRFRNATERDHNLQLHGRHSPLHDGHEPVPPGGKTVYEIEAGPAGMHPYHCRTMPIDRHVAKGLCGKPIVDPPGGRPDAHAVVLAPSGWDVDDDGNSGLCARNGVAGLCEKFPIEVAAGEPLRDWHALPTITCSA